MVLWATNPWRTSCARSPSDDYRIRPQTACAAATVAATMGELAPGIPAVITPNPRVDRRRTAWSTQRTLGHQMERCGESSRLFR